MEILKEYNGLKFGDRCLVMNVHNKIEKMTFLAYVPDNLLPYKLVDGLGYSVSNHYVKPVIVDTRKVVGWWVTWCGHGYLSIVDSVSVDGLELSTFGWTLRKFDKVLFSKDPFAPIDYWRTIEEICFES